jgi:uncharacterized protein (TIGR00369 family)
MNRFDLRDPDYEARLRASFARQGFMATLGVELDEIAPGRVTMRLAYRDGLSQQHGYFHGGVIGTLADNVCGYAAFTLLRAEDSLLTAEYKINILAPGRGMALRAEGMVLRPGRRLTVSEAKIYAEQEDGTEKLCAAALSTLMTLPDTPDDPAV